MSRIEVAYLDVSIFAFSYHLDYFAFILELMLSEQWNIQLSFNKFTIVKVLSFDFYLVSLNSIRLIEKYKGQEKSHLKKLNFFMDLLHDDYMCVNFKLSY